MKKSTETVRRQQLADTGRRMLRLLESLPQDTQWSAFDVQLHRILIAHQGPRHWADPPAMLAYIAKHRSFGARARTKPRPSWLMSLAKGE